MDSTTAILMLGPAGQGELARLLAGARAAAAQDVLEMLADLPAIGRIIVAHAAGAAPDPRVTRDPKIVLAPDPPGPFHFGRRLARLIADYGLKQVLYLGAGSQPLLPLADLARQLDRLAQAAGPTVLTNNVHSVDWAALNNAERLADIADWLDRDNMLAWRLRETAGFQATGLPPSAASRLDIDTPFDLRVLALHPRTPPRLAACLAGAADHLQLDSLRRAIQVLKTPGSRVTLIGRAPSSSVDALGGRQLWTRVFSEERGMVANRRQAEGRVISLVADYIDRIGEAGFVEQLTRTSDLVLFDTRVYLAHHGLWPADEERFAFDLAEGGVLSDARLRRLAGAARTAPIPILLGGHNAVSGGLLGLLEIAAATSPG
jgi:hypothetical protein